MSKELVLIVEMEEIKKYIKKSCLILQKKTEKNKDLYMLKNHKRKKIETLFETRNKKKGSLCEYFPNKKIKKETRIWRAEKMPRK